MRLEGQFEGDIDCKRFYMPGLKAYDTCSICQKEIVNDYAEQYISFPKIGKPCFLHFWCAECNHEWVRKIKLKVSINILD